MKEGLQIHIPTPCHEDWQQMKPVDTGRFCQSCAKQVVDFSVMTDQEILTHLSKAAGNLCGRFADDQLQRPLLPLKKEKKKIWWIAAMMPLLLLFEKSSAGKKKMWQGEPAVHKEKTATSIKGGMRSQPLKTSGLRAIYGRVVNAAGQPVPFASIILNDKYGGITAGEDGMFNAILQQKIGPGTLEVSAVGYENKKIFISYETNECIVTLNPVANVLNPVVVTSYASQRCSTTTGSYTKVSGDVILAKKYRRSLKDTVQKLFTGPAFKVFPNPAQKGSSINITIKNKGTWSIQLFDNNGKLLLVKNFEAAEGATQASVNIPPSLAAGTYYIRLVDDKKKKQYTDKIIVM